MKQIFNLLSLCILITILSGCGFAEKIPDLCESVEVIEKSDLNKNEHEFLCVPTQMCKIGDDYFIVDCYHSQIITSKDINYPINSWNVMSDKINMGHTICSDGIVYLCDDTENNRVLVYGKNGKEFYLIKIFENIGKRPHFISYYKKNDTFYALSSLTGEFYQFKRIKNSYEVELTNVVKIPQLDNVYVRSFSFIDGLIMIPAGNGFIYDINPDTFEIISFHQLPPELGGPTQITKINDYYYLTVSTDIFANSDFSNIVRAQSLDDFKDAKYESIKSLFTDEGTPYVITEIDGKYYLAYHADDGKNCMWSFEVNKKNEIQNVTRVFE